MLVGPSGTGKSHLAMAVAHTIQEQRIAVLWVFVPTFLDELRGSLHTQAETTMGVVEVMQMLVAAPCVVLDGFGTGYETPWAEAQLYQLLAQRTDRNVPTVITTNRVLETFNPLIRTRLTQPDQSMVCRVVGYESEFIHDLLRSITPAQRAMTFESFNLEPFSEAEQQRYRYNPSHMFGFLQRFGENPQGKTLVLMGPHGNGKTHLALAVANRRWQLGLPAVYVSLSHVLDRLRRASRGETTESLETMLHVLRMMPLLIIDNFSTDQATAWAQQMCFQLVDDRIVAQQATLVCTTHTLEEFNAPLQSRFSDQALSGVLAMLAPDYRKIRTR